MKKLFISYARDNKSQVEGLVRVLSGLGHQVWVDSSLHGGQAWWDEILRKITYCDAFLAIISRFSLNSVACQSERQWAIDLGKPVLPIALEPLSQALPQELSLQHMVDYCQPGENAFVDLTSALGSIPPAPPLPQVRPTPPPAPLPILTSVADRVGRPEQLSYEEQCWILDQLRPTLNSADPEERRGGQYLLDRFSRRKDLINKWHRC